MTLQIGDLAPSFTLKSTDMTDVSLGDFENRKVVLLFFPFAFSGVCTTEMCQMRDNYGMYEKLNAQIIGISVDSPFTLKKFKEENNLSFPLLSDFNKSVSQSYGAFYDVIPIGLKGVAKRAAFIIDENGKIQYQEILENAGNLPNFEALEQVLSQ